MVIDASVAFKLVAEEPGSSDAVAWMGRTEFVAPILLHVEVANALWKRIQKGELTKESQTENKVAKLARLVRTVDETAVIPRALGMAAELGHPVYDCVYLALAESLDDDLLTADRRFSNAVCDTVYASRVRELGT